MIKKNVGVSDRIIRFILMDLLLGFYFDKMINGAEGWVILALSGLLLLSVITGYSFLYHFLNINTTDNKPQKSA